MKKALLLALIGVFALGTLVGATVYSTLIIKSGGNVEPSASMLHIFVDSENVTDDPRIDWGSLTIGDTYYVNLTVVNKGPVCRLIMRINGTCPGTMAWTGNNTLLANGDSVSADLDFTVAGPPGPFSHEIVLVAEEVA